MHHRVVFTGPPGSGKTTLLTGLADLGFDVVAESATDVIAGSQTRGQPGPWDDLESTERVVALQQARQRAADNLASTVLFDRSPVCTLALARYLDHPMGPLLTAELDRVQREQGYDRSVF